jgi:hypothetical protein
MPTLRGYYIRLVALLLGSLRMTAKEAIDAFLKVVTEVFAKSPPGALFETADLERCVETLLKERNLPLDIELDSPELPGSQCKV